MRTSLKHNIAKYKIAKSIAYLILIIYGITCLGPFIWCLMSAFKTSDEILVYPFNLPKVLQFNNFPTAWTVGRFAVYLKNTIISVFLSTIILVVIAPMTSYVIARVMPSKILYLYFTLGIMIPIHTVLLPTLILTRSFQLQNTYLSLILVYIAFRISITVFILVGFMKTIPSAYEEVAFIDGASRARIFFQIIFPLTKPAIATVGLLAVVENWRAFLMPLVLITSKKLKVITQGLQEIKGLYWTDYGLLNAGIVLAIIPVIIIYIIFQEQVIAGLTAGGIK